MVMSAKTQGDPEETDWLTLTGQPWISFSVQTIAGMILQMICEQARATQISQLTACEIKSAGEKKTTDMRLETSYNTLKCINLNS